MSELLEFLEEHPIWTFGALLSFAINLWSMLSSQSEFVTSFSLSIFLLCAGALGALAFYQDTLVSDDPRDVLKRHKEELQLKKEVEELTPPSFPPPDQYFNELIDAVRSRVPVIPRTDIVIPISGALLAFYRIELYPQKNVDEAYDTFLEYGLTGARSLVDFFRALPPSAFPGQPESIAMVPLSSLMGERELRKAFEALAKPFSEDTHLKDIRFSQRYSRPMLRAVNDVGEWETDEKALKQRDKDDEKKQGDLAFQATKLLEHTPYFPYIGEILKGLETPVPLSLSGKVRFEHMHILATIGHGKTQTLQRMILNDLQSPERPALIIIDSQGQMLETIAKLRTDREIIYIDPKEAPALNMFDVSRYASLSRIDREQFVSGLIELLEYVFAGLLKAELTQKQNVVFRYALRLLLVTPNATLLDLPKLLHDPTPYLPYVKHLSTVAQEFFKTEFGHTEFKATKQQIRRRIYGVLENESFLRMLSAPENKLNMVEAMRNGSIILVDTSKKFLKTDASSLLGRYFIALTLQAAMERNDKRPAFLYIDEAEEYFDENIDEFLVNARKKNVGLIMAHQYLKQLTTPGLKSSIATTTSIKLAGGVSHEDAVALSRDMDTTDEFIRSHKSRKNSADFACYIRNVTHSAVSITVPFFTIEEQDQLSAEEYEAFREANRERLAASVAHPDPLADGDIILPAPRQEADPVEEMDIPSLSESVHGKI